MKNLGDTSPSDRRAQSRVNDVEVGSRIRAHRKNAKMTLQGLADRLGIAYQQVQKYETGVNRIGAGRLMEIAEILGIPVARFFADHANRADAILSSNEATPVTELSAEEALQGRQLLIHFLRIKDQEKRKALLAHARNMAKGDAP